MHNKWKCWLNILETKAYWGCYYYQERFLFVVFSLAFCGSHAGTETDNILSMLPQPRSQETTPLSWAWILRSGRKLHHGMMPIMCRLTFANTASFQTTTQSAVRTSRYTALHQSFLYRQQKDVPPLPPKVSFSLCFFQFPLFLIHLCISIFLWSNVVWKYCMLLGLFFKPENLKRIILKLWFKEKW